MSEGFETQSHQANQTTLHQPKPREAVSIEAIQQSLVENFSDIKDKRVERTKKHQLTDILIIAILAIIAGAKGWEDIENYGISKQKWLEEFLALPNGIPSDDTFRRVFEFIDPEALHRCFVRWVETLVTQMNGEIVPIDGKTLRSSYDRNQGKSALHVISAWASEQRLVLAQLKVEDKSNEITAIPPLLELLDLTGCIVTIDAIGTQTDIAQKIIHKKADYVLTLKANHPTLYCQVKAWFEQAQAQQFAGIDVSYDRRIEKAHHRTEIREVWSVPVSALGEIISTVLNLAPMVDKSLPPVVIKPPISGI